MYPIGLTVGKQIVEGGMQYQTLVDAVGEQGTVDGCLPGRRIMSLWTPVESMNSELKGIVSRYAIYSKRSEESNDT